MAAGLPGLADDIQEIGFEAPRGALPGPFGVLVFGNDGYEHEPASRVEVELLKQWLADHGYGIDYFSISADGNTWVIEVRVPGLSEFLEDTDGVTDENSEQMLRAAVQVCFDAVWDCYSKANQIPPEDSALVTAEKSRAISELEAVDFRCRHEQAS